MLAEEVDGWEIQLRSAAGTTRCVEGLGFAGEVGDFLAFGNGLVAVGGYEAAVGGDFSAFALDGLLEVGFYHAHCCDGVGAEGLDYL